MNKKQLSLQNASLFAELERRAKEMEILGIRLEDAEKKFSDLKREKENLENSLKEAEEHNNELLAKIEELETALADAETKVATATLVIDTSASKQTDEASPADTQIPSTENGNNAEEILEEFHGDNTSNTSAYIEAPAEADSATENTTPLSAEPIHRIDLENTEPKSSSAFESSEPEAPNLEFEESCASPQPVIKMAFEKSAPTSDLLRDYGAKIIGKVTRVTAEVLSKICGVEDEVSGSLKTLALGKNESFKFKIMELVKGKGDPEKIMAEMDLLADEAIVYLRSI